VRLHDALRSLFDDLAVIEGAPLVAGAIRELHRAGRTHVNILLTIL
jgi:hypothetical protein